VAINGGEKVGSAVAKSSIDFELCTTRGREISPFPIAHAGQGGDNGTGARGGLVEGVMRQDWIDLLLFPIRQQLHLGLWAFVAHGAGHLHTPEGTMSGKANKRHTKSRMEKSA